MSWPTAKEPPPLLAARGPRIILGNVSRGGGLAAPLRPDAATLFGPRGACLAAPTGPLFISDTGHHRLMIWRSMPSRDGEPADLLIGQPDFRCEGRNARGAIGATTLNVPTGVAAEGGILAVADAWNHRILIWRSYPERSNQPADVVLGQADFDSGFANRRAEAPGPDTLHWPYGVTIAGGRLLVCDTGNRRVLIWHRIPERNGAPADLVLGQASFACRDENAGQGVDARGMRWPHAAAVSDGMLLVADAGNNRVMVWRSLPGTNGAPCDFVLGQTGFASQDHNGGTYLPSAGTVNMPYGVAALDDRIVIADTANSRLIGFGRGELAMGASATSLAGQPDFASKGDNRWQPASRDSLCWPYGVSACGDTLAIADSGNNRVLIWEATR
jgi:hypothetical protein